MMTEAESMREAEQFYINRLLGLQARFSELAATLRAFPGQTDVAISDHMRGAIDCSHAIAERVEEILKSVREE